MASENRPSDPRELIAAIQAIRDAIAAMSLGLESNPKTQLRITTATLMACQALRDLAGDAEFWEMLGNEGVEAAIKLVDLTKVDPELDRATKHKLGEFMVMLGMEHEDAHQFVENQIGLIRNALSVQGVPPSKTVTSAMAATSNLRDAICSEGTEEREKYKRSSTRRLLFEKGIGMIIGKISGLAAFPSLRDRFSSAEQSLLDEFTPAERFELVKIFFASASVMPDQLPEPLRLQVPL